jgi:hypothetical protein
MADNEATVTISLARKVNLGNYESVDVFVSLNGLKAGTTAAQMQPLLDTAAVGWDEINLALEETILLLKEDQRKRKRRPA